LNSWELTSNRGQPFLY